MAERRGRFHLIDIMLILILSYGQTLIVWETLFGTRFLPKDHEPPEEIGIPGLSAFPMTWWAQIQSPLRWGQIQRDSAGLD